MRRIEDLLCNLSIAGKISLLVAVLLLPLAAAGAFGLRQINRLGAEISGMTAREIPLMRSLNGLTVSQFQQSHALSVALEQGENLEVGDEASRQEFAQHRERFHQIGQRVRHHMGSANSLAKKALTDGDGGGRFVRLAHQLRGLGKEYADWEFAAERALNLAAQGKTGASSEALGQVTAERQELDRAMQNLFLQIERFTRESASAALAQKSHITALMIGISVLALAVAVGLGAVVTLSITRPLETAADIAERVSAGERDIAIPTGGSDETGQLLGTMDQMLRSVRATERQLERLSHRYELILKSAGEGIAMLDSEGKITYINPSGAEMLGWESEQLVGQNFHELIGCLAPGSVDGPACPIQGEPQEAAMGGGEQVLRRRAGSEFPAFCTVAPLREDGETRGLVIVLNDITERKSAQQQLKETVEELNRSNEELEKFAYAASHDLQEPLRKVTAFGDRLVSHLGDELDEKGRLYLEHMESATRRMKQLINDLLTYSRITTRAQPFEEVDLQEVAHNVVSDLNIRIQEADGEVEMGRLPTIEAEPVQMRQLLQNLIGNALKFHRENVPPVVQVDGEVITKEGRQFCRLTVEDNGIGFKEQFTDRIFSIFQRLHPRGEYSGTGVGLALCQKIVQRHDGTITAHSAPDEGATFVIELPLRQND